MQIAEVTAILSGGVFFLVGLLTGLWKDRQSVTSPDAQAHPYVDICHRASLLYAFAALLLAKFVEISQLPGRVELVAVGVVLFYFAAAILTYFIHGLLQDTDNQLKTPHRLGDRTLPAAIISVFMWSLVAAEVGGFLVLFYGVIVALL